MSHRGEHIEEDPIQEKIAKIIQICKENDALFGDSEFPANDESLYKDMANPPKYAEDTPEVEWKRPHEIAPDEAMLIKDGVAPGDVKQGILGDCWLLGSFLILSTHGDLLQNLIVYDGLEYGFAVFQFFQNGRW
jgi:calpain-15